MGTLTLSNLGSVHISIFPIVLYKLYSMATPKQYRPLYLENNVRIVAFAPDLRKVPFHGVIEFLCYSSTIELLLLLIFINGSYPSLKALLPCWEIVISLIAAVARKFMQGRHGGRYLLSKRSTILVSAKRLRTVPNNNSCKLQRNYCNFTYVIVC